MSTQVKLVDSRNNKVYVGPLTTTIEVGKPVKVALPDGKNEFHVATLRRFMHVGNKYWLIDKNGIKFILIIDA